MLEAIFEVIKPNQNIDKLRIFEHDFSYAAYADELNFLVKHQKSIIEILKIDNFSKISGLKPNKSKYETAGIQIDPLKGLRVALCGIQCIKLNRKIHLSYNKKLE